MPPIRRLEGKIGGGYTIDVVCPKCGQVDTITSDKENAITLAVKDSVKYLDEKGIATINLADSKTKQVQMKHRHLCSKCKEPVNLIIAMADDSILVSNEYPETTDKWYEIQEVTE